MPLPEPRPAESKEKFITRCMSDSQALKDFPENGQRYAVCQSQYKAKNEVNEKNR